MKQQPALKSAFTRLSIAVAATAFAASAAQAQQYDPQQLIQMLMQQQRGATQQPTASNGQRAAAPSISEAALAQQLSAWTPAQGPFYMERFRDGFSVNGKRVLDPEGRIAKYSLDSATGDIAYMVESLPGQYVIKLMRQGNGSPVQIASAIQQQGSWLVESVTGVRVNGARLTLSGRGFIVARDNALFRYDAGQGLNTSALPDSHTLAAVQNGDIAATGWVLLEKRQDTKQAEGNPLLAATDLGKLFGSVKALGAAVGINKSDSDYALFELESARLLPVGISLGEKQAHILSQCRRQNRVVQLCDQVDSMESVWSQGGGPNRSHYFWRVSWYATSTGPVALVMEDGIGKIQAIELKTEQRATVFERTLGIGDWSTAQLPDGRVQVKAKLGFESAINEDVVQLFKTTVSAR